MRSGKEKQWLTNECFSLPNEQFIAINREQYPRSFNELSEFLPPAVPQFSRINSKIIR